MIRAYEKGDTKIARAILTDRYKRIDNDVIATKAINRMLDVGCEIKHADYDGDNLSITGCLLYTSPSPRDGLLSRMPSSA